MFITSVRSLLITFGFANAVLAQSTLMLASASSSPGGAVALNLSLSSPAGSNPANLQWTLTYPAANVASIVVTPGPSATAAGKSVMCAGGAAAYVCMAYGMNPTVIASGVVAVVTVTLASGAGTTSMAVTNTLGTPVTGGVIPVAGSVGTILVGPVSSSLKCAATTLLQGGSTSCILTIPNAAPSGGISATLSGTSSELTVPASVLVPAGAASAGFSVSANSIFTREAATITASWSGSTVFTTLALVPPTVSALQCTPLTLAPNQSAVCSVTVANPGGTVSVSVTSDDPVLPVPASTVVLPPGLSSAQFTVVAGSFTKNQTPHVTASLNGSSKTASFFLVWPVVVSSVQCGAATMGANANTTCTVTISQPAPATAAVALAPSYSTLTVPAYANIAANATTGSFTATTGAVATAQTVTLTAALNGSSASTSVVVSPSAMSISTLSCIPSTLISGQLSLCSVSVLNPSGLPALSVSSNSPALVIPTPTVPLPANSSCVSFSIVAGVFSASQVVQITVTLNGSWKSLPIALSAPASAPAAAPALESAAARIHSPSQLRNATLSCDPRFIAAGGRSTCEVRVSSGPTGAMDLPVSTTSAHLKIPESIPIAAGRTCGRFEVAADRDATGETAVLSVRSGAHVVESLLVISPSDAPVLNVAGSQTGRPGSPLRLGIRAADGNGLPLTLTASGLPPGAVFDAAGGEFQWLPSEQDFGVHRITFAATNPAGVSTANAIDLNIKSGLPEIARLQNAAGIADGAGCTPGSAARLLGAFLSAGEGPTRVLVNEQAVAVLQATPGRVDFLCPDDPPGAALAISVATPAGRSASIHTVMQDVAPGILTVGTPARNQALALAGDSLRLATIPDFEFAGEPARPGDPLTVIVTGIRCSERQPLLLTIGSVGVAVDSIAPAADYAGLCRLTATVPAGLEGDRVPIVVQVLRSDGTPALSNTASLAVGY